MSYLESIEFLYRLQKHGIKLGLETIEHLVEGLDRPHARFPSLHIGGTNGKGSTAAIVASVLQAAGYRVGLYTSPHLVDFRERIRVNGAMIPENCVAALTERIQAVTGDVLEPTFFEWTTAMAFQHFADALVDIAVIEVGLGGRFDATNVVTPLASAIITVARDHEEYLGHTLEAIAYEKAGIIKAHVPVVVGRVDRETAGVVERVATERSAPISRLGHEFHVEGPTTDSFVYRGIRETYRDLACPLAGRHQLDNAACALALLDTAAKKGFPIREAAVRQGLQAVQWEGRLETVAHHPRLVLDGAHNPAAAETIAAHLAAHRREQSGSRVVLVLGMMREKDAHGFLDAILPQVDEVIVTQPRMARAFTVHELEGVLRTYHRSAHQAADPSDALSLARQLAADDDLILVTGSLMLVGEIKALLCGCELSPLRG